MKLVQEIIKKKFLSVKIPFESSFRASLRLKKCFRCELKMRKIM